MLILDEPTSGVDPTDIDPAMGSQRFIYVIEIPPNFQADILAGRQPKVQININATASAQASVIPFRFQAPVHSEVSGASSLARPPTER